ncbi:MAG: fumarate hydratase [Candidatus Omnitrophica bacterium]|nr:fumarate hydratase [Candidatus Omnitrophota bacterium]
MTRKIQGTKIKETVKRLCVVSGTVLRDDIYRALKASYSAEKSGSRAKEMLKVLLDNADIAKKDGLPICQDTGMVAVFVDIGQDVVVEGGYIKEMINEGVKDAYREADFRKSVVKDPILRKNTGTNAPSVIHFDIVKGDKISISIMPKGFGAENKSKIKMFNPTVSPLEIVEFCVDVVKDAGPDACPPYILGIGFGGTMEDAALMAKKALLQPVDIKSKHKHLAELAEAIKGKANDLEIGVMGLGGGSTVLGVNVAAGPTHIAGLPVAVNVSCHALRGASAII